jgi:hypothetical protein
VAHLSRSDRWGRDYLVAEADHTTGSAGASPARAARREPRPPGRCDCQLVAGAVALQEMRGGTGRPWQATQSSTLRSPVVEEYWWASHQWHPSSGTENRS